MDETLNPQSKNSESLDFKNPEFIGDSEYQPKPRECNLERNEELYPYLANVSEGLVEAVNLAIRLKRPLLLEGEPGCGKTKLARAVAYELGKRYLQADNWPYFEWSVKSTDRSRDGLYTYDAVRRLYDAQIPTTNPEECDAIHQRLNDPKHKAYRQWGALGLAFRESNDGKNPKRAVVLIDEIDKADPDFPNDLLLEIEEKRFVVTQTGEEVRANPDYAPIVFVTSNAQKQLPDAFLRRCLYHYIEFPSIEALQEIVIARFGKLWKMDLLDRTLRRFLKLRRLMEAEKGEFGKKVSTSELLDWIEALRLYASDDEDLDRLLGKNQLPYANTLIKTKDDRELVKYMEEEGTDDDD
ncbi:MAG: MoxR family ATPase [Cyanobacteria bacterium SID2]|nr:MoxR family ATPase [Cyanobacteria bacterium SID2]